MTETQKIKYLDKIIKICANEKAVKITNKLGDVADTWIFDPVSALKAIELSRDYTDLSDVPPITFIDDLRGGN